MKFIILLFTLAFLPKLVFAQGKKELKKSKVQSIVVTNLENNKVSNVSKSIYDENGELIEDTEYNKDGNIKKTTLFKYNTLGDVIEEIELDQQKKIIEKRIIRYNLKGKKLEEIVFDKQNRNIKKVFFAYNEKGLKTLRTTTDSTGAVLQVRKFIYEYK